MTDPTTPGDATPPPSRSAAMRWLPWIGVLAAAALLFVLVRPSSDDDEAAPPDSVSTETAGEDTGATDTASADGGSEDTSSGETPSTAGDTGEAAQACDERQLADSEYGPCKIEPFSGDNGGATSQGVAEDTITVSFRLGNSGQLASLNSLAGEAAASLGSNQEAVVEDINALVDYFNDQFELYGRRVVVETFEGQGDFLAEFQAKDVQGAQVDAARATDLGAFADVSFTTMTQPYAEALTAADIIAMSPVYLSEDWYADRAPYAYGAAWPLGTQVGEFAGNAVCEALAGQPAEYAADDLASTNRTFGLLAPENPEYAKMADAAEAALASCGESVGRRLSFALDIVALQPEATNAIAQMKEAGVTTIICLCDEFSPLFLTGAAFTQEYGPEWLMMRWPDPWGRLTAPDIFARSMHLGGMTPVFEDSEIGTVVDAATGGSGVASPASIDGIYKQLLMLFSGLQAAGPDLTPETFQAGIFSLPATDDGVFGPWEHGEGVYNPNTSFQLGWWSAEALSNLDGIAGSVQDCGSGDWYRFDDVAGLGAEGTSPGCFG